MRSFHFAAVLLLAVLCLAVQLPACSAYKITASGKTMAGSNYDSWFVNPVIWFETNGYGAAFSGARREGENSIAPQTGLNEHGLAFVSLATVAPENGPVPLGKKVIASRSAYLKDILHSCRTTEEVRTYVEQYDHSALINDVFLYTDSSGHFLVVEPYVLTSGEEASYILGNFCPSTVTDFSSIPQARYVNGSAFVKNRVEATLAFCTALSDTMHVCREKIGDGTLLTSILDLSEGIIHLYFYHDYSQHAQINLKEELARGEHRMEIASLFPVNAEYEKFLAFKTPATSPVFRTLLFACAALLFLSGIIFLFSFFRSRGEQFRLLKLLLLPLCWVLSFYMLILLRNDGIFYYPAPYNDQSSVLTLAAYIPFLLLIALIPLLIANRKLITHSTWSSFMRRFFTGINAVLLLLVACFGYWGLYAVI
jgi:hypothetical protein